MSAKTNGKRFDGIHPSTQKYISSPQIAKTYDKFFSYTPLFEYDSKFLQGHINEPGPLVDLGCGTGRHISQFSHKGFFTVGVDISRHMLDCVRDKAEAAPFAPRLIHGDLCRLGFLRDASFRYAICMFSTIGLIHGKRNRALFVREVGRILQPGGVFIFHVHNFWQNFFEPQGRSWLFKSFTINRFKGLEPGDKIMDGYRGIPNMFLHVFTLREIKRLIERNGFSIRTIVPLNILRDGPLTGRWKNFKSNGFIVAAAVK